MIWNNNGDVISIDEHDFAINSRWFVEFGVHQRLKAAVLTTSKMLVEDVSCGLVLNHNGSRQIVKIDNNSMGLPLLSAYFIGKKKNCCVFAKVGADRYWSISINNGGFVSGSLDNDKCHSLEGLKKFIYQEMIMSDDQSLYSIINVGEDTDLSSVELNLLLIHEPFEPSRLSDSEIDEIRSTRQIGFRRTQIAIAIGGFAAGILGCGYYFFYVTPPIVADILDGTYSSAFTAQYNSLKESEDKLFNNNNKKKTRADLNNSALDGFNEFLLTKNGSNINELSNVFAIRNALPRRVDGWVLDSIANNNGTTEAVYSMISGYPISLPYTNLDVDLGSALNDSGFISNPIRLLNSGNTRVYEVKQKGLADGLVSAKYAKYLAIKRENVDGRQALIRAIKGKQAQVDQVKSKIEEAEQSVELLSAFDAHNSAVINLILDNIRSNIASSKALVSNTKCDLEKLKSYKPIQPPANKEFLLDSNGMESIFIPILQSIENITWGQPRKTMSFPSVVGLNREKIGVIGFVGITGYEFSIELNSKSSPISGIEPLLNDKRLFLVGAKINTNGEGLPKTMLRFMYFVGA